VITDRNFDAVLNDRGKTIRDKIQRALERLLWFWPRVVDATVWAAGEPGKRQTPINYLTIDGHARLLLHWVEQMCPDRNACVLDIGCNCGRHVIALYEAGYRNLVGVDAMRSAIALFAERAPAAFSGSEIHHDLFQRFLMRQPDGRFELTYSHGSTIELVHPSFDVVAHICRITRRHVCLLITESEYFRRDWTRQFDRRGFRLVHSEPLRDPVNGAKLFVFSRGRDKAALAHGPSGQPDA
jgi:SAM-dependent methyltransferase